MEAALAEYGARVWAAYYLAVLDGLFLSCGFDLGQMLAVEIAEK